MHSASQKAYYLQVIFLGLVVGIGLQIAQAWTVPAGAPPTQVVSAPITTGNIAQVKQSSLSINGNLVANQVQLNTVVTEGAACTSNGLLARNTNGLVLSCQSLVWSKAGGGAVALTSYNMLPTGAVAGRCALNVTTSQSGSSGETSPIEPAYLSGGGSTCACRAGFTPMRTGTYPTGVMVIETRYYTCIKN